MMRPDVLAMLMAGDVTLMDRRQYRAHRQQRHQLPAVGDDKERERLPLVESDPQGHRRDKAEPVEKPTAAPCAQPGQFAADCVLTPHT